MQPWMFLQEGGKRRDTEEGQVTWPQRQKWRTCGQNPTDGLFPFAVGDIWGDFCSFFGGILLVCFAYRFPPLLLLLMSSVEESLEKFNTISVLTLWAFYYPLGYPLTQLCTNSFLYHKCIMTPTMCWIASGITEGKGIAEQPPKLLNTLRDPSLRIILIIF